MNKSVKYTRKSKAGVNMSEVKLFPNGKHSSDKTVENLATIGIQLKGKQIIDFATSIMEMAKEGHQEVNITGWFKKGTVTFLGKSVKKL